MDEEKRKRGFQLLSKERHLEIASAGGKKAHELGVAHELTTEEARAAGRKGGQAVAKDVAHMANIGRKGGRARWRKKR